jgi:hypothetical protein
MARRCHHDRSSRPGKADTCGSVASAARLRAAFGQNRGRDASVEQRSQRGRTLLFCRTGCTHVRIPDTGRGASALPALFDVLFDDRQWSATGRTPPNSAGQQPTVHLGEDLLGMPRQPIKRRCVEYLAVIFRDVDRMHNKPENPVSFAS